MNFLITSRCFSFTFQNVSSVKMMRKYFVLFLIFCELENRICVSLKPVEEALKTTCPMNSCLHNVTQYEYLNVSLPLRGCFCDQICKGLRDCCEDSQFYDEKELHTPSTLECDYDLPDQPGGYYINRMCPDPCNDLELVEKCDQSFIKYFDSADLRLKVPVTSLSSGITYGNVYCALCNGEYDFITWNVTVSQYCNGYREVYVDDEKGKRNITVYDSIEPKDASDLKFKEGRWYLEQNQMEYVCELTPFKPEDLKLNICRPHEFLRGSVIDSCWENMTDVDILNQCQGAYAMVSHYTDNGDYKRYKNKFCAYCNGLNDSQLVCKLEPFIYDENFDIHYIEFVDRSFSVMFNYKIDLSDTKYCERLLAEGKNWSEISKCLGATDVEAIQSSKNSENWFFSAYTSFAVLISSILLILHLIVFAVVKELHTIGGQNLASFCIALILAYCNFLIGNFSEGKACFVVAIATYYSFLSAFSWMFIISFDIWRTFTGLTKNLNSGRNSKYKFLIYSIWSWTIPALVVLIAVYFDLSKSHSALAPHFGENGCWFHNGHSLLWFFVVPVSVIILINFVLFLHVSIILHNNQCESVNQKAYVDFKLHIRMGLLTGFTWITGFIAGYFQNVVIWFTFIILNTSQGIFIFAAFTCKRRIILSFLKTISSLCGLPSVLRKLENSTVVS